MRDKRGRKGTETKTRKQTARQERHHTHTYTHRHTETHTQTPDRVTYLSELLHKKCCNGDHDVQLLPLWSLSQLGQNSVHEDTQEHQVANLKRTTGYMKIHRNIR